MKLRMKWQGEKHTQPAMYTGPNVEVSKIPTFRFMLSLLASHAAGGTPALVSTAV